LRIRGQLETPSISLLSIATIALFRNSVFMGAVDGNPHITFSISVSPSERNYKNWVIVKNLEYLPKSLVNWEPTWTVGE
jgi:hypothetical protein